MHNRFETLFQRYFNKTASEAEKAELMEYIASQPYDVRLSKWVEELLYKTPEGYEMKDEAANSILQSILTAEIAPIKKIFTVRRIIAAAIFILAIGSGIYYFNNQSNKSQKSSQITVQTNDIMPGGNRASLTVGNKTIELSSNKEGIINHGNQLTYSDGSAITGTTYNLERTTYNTLTTPRGGQYQAVLPDGSKVWLNAESSIKFPSKFGDNERRVEVTGEVYMEIAKNLKAPFSVSAGNTVIQVLGTSFNINAYPEEKSQRTTLISGSVRVLSNNQTAILQPGQQANIPINEIKQITVQTADIEQTIAWKNGLFNFDGATVDEFMQQIARWYNLEVIYKGPIPATIFKGSFSRNFQLSQIMTLLTHFKIKYKLEGRTITIE